MVDKRTTVLHTEAGRPVRIEWRVEAVVDNDSIAFAAKLQDLMNAASKDGYVLCQMLGRPIDNGMVVVHQRALFLDGDEPDGVREPLQGEMH